MKYAKITECQSKKFIDWYKKIKCGATFKLTYCHSLLYETLNTMKSIPLFLLAFLPFCLFAQPDYCTCMEQSNEYDGLMQYFTNNSELPINVKPQKNLYIPPQPKEENTRFVPLYMDVNTFPGAEQQVEAVTVSQKSEVDEQVQQIEKPERLNQSPNKEKFKAKRKAKIRKKRKRLKGKVKRRKKAKKYKGACPNF